MNKLFTRRDLLKRSAVGAIGMTLLPGLLRAAPSDKVRVAHIGLGSMGTQHMKWFAGLPDVEIVGLCDVDSNHLSKALLTLKELRPGNQAKGYEDFRQILDRHDVDAVTVATPDHWHAQIASLAFQAGKDVYGEKPLSYDVKEGSTMLKNLERHQRVFQLGTQIHAGDNYHRVVELIRAGSIGKVHTVRLWRDSYSREFADLKVQTPPPGLNWDMWLGPAPYVDYIPEKCHSTFRYFRDYSGGVFADFWCHIADVVWWSIQPRGLKTVSATGEATSGGVPKWLDADFGYDDLKIHWTTKAPNVPGTDERNIGAYFEGDKGTLICDYNTRSLTINGESMSDIASVPQSIERSPGHQQNFIDSVKSRKQAESNLAYAREMTLPMHLALASWKLGRKLQWNSKKEKFLGDKEANGLLSRKYREKWDLL